MVGTIVGTALAMATASMVVLVGATVAAAVTVLAIFAQIGGAGAVRVSAAACGATAANP